MRDCVASVLCLKRAFSSSLGPRSCSRLCGPNLLGAGIIWPGCQNVLSRKREHLAHFSSIYPWRKHVTTHKKLDCASGNWKPSSISNILNVNDSNIHTLIESLFSERVGSTIIIKGKLIRAFFFSA